MSDSKHAVIKQASFLMAATLFCRVIGLLYRSPLHTIMGNLGDGYYSFAYEWYNIILLIASYSIPMAVSKVMAELLAVKQFKNAQRVFHAAMIYVLIVGSIGALVAFFGAPFFLMKQPGAVLALRVLAPTIFLSGILGVLRGYFQARNNMMPTALSQIGEQIMNAIISVFAAWALTRPYTFDYINTGIYGAAGGTLGTGAGVVTGLIIMTVIYCINRGYIKRCIDKDEHEDLLSMKECFHMILMMVTPVLLATCVYNLSGIVDQVIFTWLMPLKGADAEFVSLQYSLFGYEFRPIINIPIALASATSTALIPAIASNMAEKKVEEASEKITTTIGFTMFLAIPAAVGIAVLSLPIVSILYPGESAVAAAQVLTVGAVSVLFYCLSTVTNGVLQGLGKPSLPVKHAAIALVVNAVAVAIGVFVFTFPVMSIVVATILYAATVSLLNAHSVKKQIPYKVDYKNTYFYPVSASVIMGIVVAILYWGIYRHVLFGAFGYMGHAIYTVCVVIVGIIVYMIAYVLISGKTASELRKMPMGTRVLQVLRVLHIPVKKDE